MKTRYSRRHEVRAIEELTAEVRMLRTEIAMMRVAPAPVQIVPYPYPVYPVAPPPHPYNPWHNPFIITYGDGHSLTNANSLHAGSLASVAAGGWDGSTNVTIGD